MTTRLEFINDPMAGVNMSVNFDFSMMREMRKLYSKKACAKLNPQTPIDIFGGTMDPIGGNKASKAKKLDRMYRACGIPGRIHLYEGARHDLLAEINSEEVMNDILAFFDSAL